MAWWSGDRRAHFSHTKYAKSLSETESLLDLERSHAFVNGRAKRCRATSAADCRIVIVSGGGCVV